MKSDRKGFNSTLRPVSKKRQAEIKAGIRPKKPAPRKKVQDPEVTKVAPKVHRITAKSKKSLKFIENNPVLKKMVVRASSLPARSKTNTGWYGWAVENVWNRRKMECQVCGLWLGESDTPDPTFFSHLLPRGSYRRYKLDERNVIIKCADCHELWHKMGPEKLKDIREWKLVCNTYFSLRNEANNV